ncbi:MAG TPA: sulfate transporter, partial [Planctomycetaceae bacterium]|nr:sulfate transporter [Planctomycetaceae bacterium]
AALTIAIVASLETLLNLEAVDKLDPKKRPSPANRELLAQGAGNCVAGLVGALPVTSVIIRSSVNIHSGVETKRSAIIHGIFLVCAVIIFAGLMNQIPLACLAAILIMTGFKLASPKLFISLWKQGYQQFVPFIVTLLAIVFTDLLVGVIVGLVVALICIPIFNFKNAIQLKQGESNEDDVIRVELSEKVSFLSRLSIKKTFDTFQPNSTIVIDGSKNLFIDPDTLEMIDDYAKRVGPDNQVNVSIEGLDMSPLEMASGGH